MSKAQCHCPNTRQIFLNSFTLQSSAIKHFAKWNEHRIINKRWTLIQQIHPTKVKLMQCKGDMTVKRLHQPSPSAIHHDIFEYVNFKKPSIQSAYNNLYLFIIWSIYVFRFRIGVFCIRYSVFYSPGHTIPSEQTNHTLIL